jgi:hypothetical protein
MQTQCKTPCHAKKSTVSSVGVFSFLPGVLIALIPKCPFCILSFTSAITVCSSKSLSAYSPHWTSFISIGFTLLTIIIVALNYKGVKTQLALVVTVAGSILVSYSELYSGLLQPYYWGCSLLIMGVWMNGSLSFFLKKIKSTARLSLFSSLYA